MKSRIATGNTNKRALNTREACEYLSIGRNSLYKYFKQAQHKIGARTVWDVLVLDQTLEALQRESVEL